MVIQLFGGCGGGGGGGSGDGGGGGDDDDDDGGGGIPAPAEFKPHESQLSTRNPAVLNAIVIARWRNRHLFRNVRCNLCRVLCHEHVSICKLA